jgi:tRNA(Ile)-lysidine synthase
MRALFGAGAGGLASIAPVRGRIVRPLLGAERAQVRAWLESVGETWREDESNLDTARLRARIRAVLVPAAEQINPAFRAALARTMDLLGDDDALLGSMAAAFARDFADYDDGREVSFSVDWMKTLDPTMARRTVRSGLITAFPDASRIEAEHIEALVEGFSAEGFAHDLPGGLRAFREYDKMVISRNDAAPAGVAPTLLTVTGTTDLGDAGRITAEIAEADDTNGTADSVVIDVDRVSGELTVDSPRPGDRMRPLGMRGTRKISDLLVDEKVPRRTRTAVPVVRDGEHVVWLAGVRVSDDFRVTPETRRAIRLTWERK